MSDRKRPVFTAPLRKSPKIQHLLRVVRERPWRSTEELARTVGLTRAVVDRYLWVLDSAGVIQRKQDPAIRGVVVAMVGV